MAPKSENPYLALLVKVGSPSRTAVQKVRSALDGCNYCFVFGGIRVPEAALSPAVSPFFPARVSQSFSWPLAPATWGPVDAFRRNNLMTSIVSHCSKDRFSMEDAAPFQNAVWAPPR